MCLSGHTLFFTARKEKYMKKKPLLILLSIAATCLCSSAAILSACGDGAPHEHNLGALIAEQPATCLSAGLREHYRCDGCGKYFDVDKAETTLEALQIPSSPEAHSLYASDDKCSLCGARLTAGLKYTEIRERGKVAGYSVGRGAAADSRVEIPALYEGLPVTAVDAGGFENYISLESVTIPAGIKQIGAKAFENCISLKTAALPQGLQKLGDSAFENCISLEYAALPYGTELVGNYAFRECASLAAAEIYCKTIGDGAFYGCASLESAMLGGGCRAIGEYAFKNCAALENIAVPADVTKIGYGAFENCVSLESAVTEGGVIEICEYAFSGCAALKRVDVGDGITDIDTFAFAGCGKLEIVDVGGGITKISNLAFMDCAALESVTIGDGIAEIGEYAFQDCAALKNATVPASAIPAVHKSSLRTVCISGGAIGGRAFGNCALLTSVVIGGGVTAIGVYAFENCASLESVIFENGAGWKVYDYPDMSSSAEADVADSAENARRLCGEWCGKYWKRV